MQMQNKTGKEVVNRVKIIQNLEASLTNLETKIETFNKTQIVQALEDFQKSHLFAIRPDLSLKNTTSTWVAIGNYPDNTFPRWCSDTNYKINSLKTLSFNGYDNIFEDLKAFVKHLIIEARYFFRLIKDDLAKQTEHDEINKANINHKDFRELVTQKLKEYNKELNSCSSIQ